MENFVFQNTTRIIFGAATELKAGAEVKKYSSKILLHYGGGSIKKTGLYAKVTESLQAAGVEFLELPGVQPNPRLSLVEEGIRLCRENEVNFILAVGGGSVIDSAKAIAIGVPYQGEVWDFYSGKARPKEALPVGVILTIPAAGSESSTASVITNENGWYKRGTGGNVLMPQFAIMNPELTYTLPPYQTACGAADIMAHIMERYFTNVRDVDLTDRLCEATMKTLIKNVPIALQEPDNYAARAEIMWTGTIAHNNLLSTGRIGDWSSHDIEHELSAIYDVPHGAGLAVVFPAWMHHVYRHDLTRFAQFAARVWNVEYDPTNLERTALEGIRRLTYFFQEIGLPVTLAELDIPTDRLEEMAAKCTDNNTATIGSFQKLNQDDVLAILRSALG